ncbi:PAS domain S-box protein [Deinococcus deserti]|uniref:histidine kinase n=1 Tax=Deinococcus deserti (strain DSM 17065 / CIP 109153 / LMG 22923 / VCD115) TaxID=546414 RepID=C1D1X7_DEIDV|nr:PAS domain S-box protein [Deinococcus deserti]ACO47416.1 putative histidine kinase, classic [Deinococcus deserti VCD115]
MTVSNSQGNDLLTSDLLSVALDAFIGIDQHGRVIEWNPAAERTFGYTRQEALGQAMNELIIPPAFQAAHQHGMARYLETGLAKVLYQRLRLEAQRRDGEIFPCELVIHEVQIQGARSFIASLRDLTEQVRAETALRKREADHRTLIENTAVGVARVDIEGRWLEVNPAIERFLGYSEAELRGLTFRDVSHPDDLSQHNVGLFSRLVNGEGGTFTLEKRYIRKDGVVVWGSVTVSPVVDPVTGYRSTVAVIHDITDRKRAEEYTERLHRVTADLARALTPEAVLDVTLAEVMPAMGAAAGGALLIDDSEDYLEALGHAGYSEEMERRFSRVPLTMSLPVTDTARTGEPYFLTSQELLERYPHLAGQREQFRSGAGLPLRVGDQITGVLVLSFSDDRLFSGADQTFMTSVADQCAQAIERARLYEVSRISVQRYRSLVETTSRIVWTRSPEGTFDHDQPQWTAFTGQRSPELLGMGWLDAVHPEDRARTADSWQNAVSSGTPYETKYRLRRADGMFRHMHVRAIPLRDDDGTLREWIGVHTDITERLEAELALRESQGRLRFALEAAQLGDWEMSLHDHSFRQSPRHDEIFGYPQGRPHWTYETFLEHVLPEDREDVNRKFTWAMEQEEAWDIECRIRRADGEVRWIWTRGQAQKQPHGRARHMLGIVGDITVLKRAEAEVRALNVTLEQRVRERTQELERSNRDLEQFAYVASHDLQEPLRTVTSYTELLARRYGGQLDEKAEKYMTFTVAAARRMGQLVQDLLDFSRVRAENHQVSRLDPNEVMVTLIRDLEETIEANGAAVSWDNLPAVHADAVQFRQLLQNLIGNGLKFHRDGVAPAVHVSARIEGQSAHFQVQDNGIGIERQYFDRIFAVFQRLHTRDRYQGTGVGLALCKRIVERHGGQIWLDSVPGEGTTFHFTLQLPLTETEAAGV